MIISLFEWFNEMHTSTSSEYKPPISTVPRLITCSNDWLQYQKWISILRSCKQIVYIKRWFDTYLSPFFCDQCNLISSMNIDTLYHALQFETKHILIHTIEINDPNIDFKITSCKNNSSRPDHSVQWMVKVTETNMVSRNSLFTMLFLSP